MARSAPAVLLIALLLAVTFATLAPAARGAENRAASISWRSFEPATFLAAKEEGKLILLWIHAPWGHWDRVMSEITFVDPQVVSVINQKFISIRVDALLRPDIYARYGMGGWPTTAFLLPTGQPLYFPDASRKIVKAGGTYYSSESLAYYLGHLAKYYAENKEAAEKAAEEIAQGVLSRKEVGTAPVTPEIMEVSVTKLLEAYAPWRFDPTLKMAAYPDADSAELAFAYYVKKGNREVADAALHILTEMARGGIRDQIGGGFHRFSTDAAWRVPAFEKLLLVNAEMLQVYSHVYKLTLNGRYLAVAEEIARYVTGTLGDPAGWLYAYQAAETRLGEEGDYYTWTLEEAKAVLTGEEQKILLPAYDIGEWGDLVNTAPRRNVLFLSEGPRLLSERLGMEESKVTEIFESGRKKLLETRSRREAPPLGRTLVTDANAAMAASLIMAGDALRRSDLRDAGLKALDFVWDNARDPGSKLMDHVWMPQGGRAGLVLFFTDQAQMIRALLAAHESTGDGKYLDRARELIDAADKSFADSLNGGYMDRIYSADAPGLLSWPTRSIRDNALFAEALVRLRHLSGLAGDEKYIKVARKTLEAWADEYANYKEMSSAYGLASDRFLNPPLEVIVVGSASDAGYEGLRTQAKALHHTWKVVRYLGPQEIGQALGSRQVTPPQGAGLVLCMGSRCAGPFTEQENLRVKLEEFLNPDRKPAAEAAQAGKELP